MINAAIVGLGRWGKNLVNSTSDSAALRFTTANTRTRQTAEIANCGVYWDRVRP